MSRAAIPAEAFEHGDPKRYWRGCRCSDCRTAASRRARQSRYLCATGRRSLCNGLRAGKHIQRLRRAGMTDLQISAAAKVSTTTLARITTQSGLVRRAVEQRILAVASPAAGPVISKAPVDPTGTVRRLRALVVAGWPPSALAARSGTDARHLRRVLNESYGFVTLRLEERVRALFANLWNQGPADHGVSPVSVARARKVAVLRGWHPAAVWDDIDNPAEQPNYGEHTPRPDAIVEDVAELVAQGLTREAIAERLGITWDAVQKAHARLSTPLPELAA